MTIKHYHEGEPAPITQVRGKNMYPLPSNPVGGQPERRSTVSHELETVRGKYGGDFKRPKQVPKKKR